MIRAVAVACLLGAAAGTPWGKYLAGHNYANPINWVTACQKLGQTPSGYGMGSGGGKKTYHLKCDSNPIDVVCSSSSCTSSYVPAKTAGDTPPPGKFDIKAPASSCSKFSSEQVQAFLNIHNKMRCAVGAPPVHWDRKLECQAQHTQDKIGAFKHSDSYSMKIAAGENLATGKSPENAAWMWFTEYLQSTDYAHGGETGHYSAMSWKGVTKIGCGVGDGSDGKGVVRCQYHGSPLPNMAGSYGTNLDTFYGEASSFKKCGMTAGEVKGKASLYKKWGILRPTGKMASNIGLYSVTDEIWSNTSPTAFFSACAFIGAAAMVTVAVVVRRRRSLAQEDRELLAVEAVEDGLE